MEALIKLAVFLVLVTIGYFRGRKNEKAHLIALRDEEATVKDILVFATRYPDPSMGVSDPVLVSGSAVVSADFFRFFVANLRKFLGGRYHAYESLNDRARRQAIVRMKQAAKAHNVSNIFNMRINTARISHPREGGTPQVEVHVYGTGFVPAQGTVAQSAVHFTPADFAIPQSQAAYDLLQKPATRLWVIGWFLLVFYAMAELVGNGLVDVQLRYVNGAPWYLFLALSVALTAPLLAWSHRSGTPLGEKIILPILTVPAFMAFLYFFVIRLHILAGFTTEAVPYTVQAGGQLNPVQAENWPVIDPGDYRDYWAMQAVGSNTDIQLIRGAFGLYLYNIAPLRDQYQQFYRTQDH